MALPGALAAQRVVVVFYKAVYEVYRTQGVLDPLDVEIVPLAEVSGAVVLNQQRQGALLDVVLRHFAGKLQLGADLFDCGAVDAADLPGQLMDDAKRILDHLGVEAVGDGMAVAGIDNRSVIRLNLVTGDAFVEVDGRQFDDVSFRRGAAPLRADLRVVDIAQQISGLI